METVASLFDMDKLTSFVLAAPGLFLAQLAKFQDPVYAWTFCKQNFVVILLLVAYIAKNVNNVEMKEVEGSLVQSIKTLEDWNSKVEKSMSEDKLVVCDFYANWCPPCRKASPVFAELSIFYRSKPIVFWKVDVDAVQAVTKSQSVSSLPTFRIYGRGPTEGDKVRMVELKSLLGWSGPDDLVNAIEEQLTFAANKRKALDDLRKMAEIKSE